MSTRVSPNPSREQALTMMLKALRLPSFAGTYTDLATKGEQEGWSFGAYLHQLCELELAERQERRISRNLKRSGLPAEKNLATLDLSKIPKQVARQLPTLCDGGFLGRQENLLVFGLPGRGKTHLVCAVGQELIRRGRTVLFTPTYQLVQRLLAAKRDLVLERELKRLDSFDAVILDDIGYVQQDRDEMEVLFTFLAQRYERRSVIITSNLVFKEWDRIFKDPMTTAAAIDRIIHHSVIVEMRGPSIRENDARQRTTSVSTKTQQSPKNSTSTDGEF